ncbi:MAG: sortase [Eggerthellaceae bacterium]
MSSCPYTTARTIPCCKRASAIWRAPACRWAARGRTPCSPAIEGLPSAALFTDLDRLKEGDTFTITVLNKTLTYEVDQIRIVEPTDLSSLQIEKGKDLCTLVTCTPYGINTHRLLVRGHRIPNANGDAQVIAEALQVPPAYIALAVVIVVLLVLIAYSFVRMRSRRKASDFQASYLAEQGLQRPNVDMHDEEAQGFLQRLRNYLQGR